MERKRNLIYFKKYFHDFFDKQSEKTKDKIDYVLFLVTVSERIPSKFFESITGYDVLYAIRIEFESNFLEYFVVLMKGV